ncbi:MAG: low molecular weight phosphotyrosine protein phosphatase [Prolixibacteraceae bacterium]|nr:low molecular weight phosphotyrosine protein phosphatase [Prolixibacteraceae bacterium]
MKKSVLFVCLGNICRSPSAEAVFRAVVKKAGLEQAFDIDSAGTIAVHSGEPADARMQQHALKRGYHLTSISRRIHPAVDFDRFDYIIAMDDQNLRDLQAMARNAGDVKKISKMTDYAKRSNHTSVPDPYYGGAAGFELVLDLLEDACEGLLLHVQNQK